MGPTYSCVCMSVCMLEMSAVSSIKEFELNFSTLDELNTVISSLEGSSVFVRLRLRCYLGMCRPPYRDTFRVRPIEFALVYFSILIL